MYAIHGSQINAPAKLYKRFTASEEDKHFTTSEEDGEEVVDSIIKYEQNYYRAYARLRYVEATDLQGSDEQPLQGLIVSTGHMTIKILSTYKPKKKDLSEPNHGDILAIGGELWLIDDGIQRVRLKSMRNLATVYIPLRRLI